MSLRYIAHNGCHPSFPRGTTATTSADFFASRDQVLQHVHESSGVSTASIKFRSVLNGATPHGFRPAARTPETHLPPLGRTSKLLLAPNNAHLIRHRSGQLQRPRQQRAPLELHKRLILAHASTPTPSQDKNCEIRDFLHAPMIHGDTDLTLHRPLPQLSNPLPPLPLCTPSNLAQHESNLPKNPSFCAMIPLHSEVRFVRK